MLFARRTRTFALWLAVACAAPLSARAQGAPTGARVQLAPGTRAALVAERQRVRVDLDHANADVDALKRANRSLRDDYRLRARLADAEALARRLTELDARLGTPAAPRAQTLGADPVPRGLPSDGPAELEAKADILSDQARRLAARGDALIERAHDLKARQNLRRRVGQMERDPFSPLEGSKRRAMAAGTTASLAGGAGAPKGSGPAVGSMSPEAHAGGSGAAVAPAVDQAAPPPASGSAPARGDNPSAPSLGTTSVAGPGSAVTSPKTVPTPTGVSEGLALSPQLRDLLDPATLAEIQRVEATSGAVSGIDALERAGTALKARAERLAREAAALRAGGPAKR